MNYNFKELLPQIESYLNNANPQFGEDVMLLSGFTMQPFFDDIIQGEQPRSNGAMVNFAFAGKQSRKIYYMDAYDFLTALDKPAVEEPIEASEIATAQ